MKTHVLILSLLVSGLAEATCKLPQNEKIIVGCTDRCDFFTRSRLKAAGARLGYKVKVVELEQTLPIEKSLTEVDSVLFPGGADIDPRYYLKSVTKELRDYTEKNLHLVKFTQEGRRRDPFEYGLLTKILSSERDYKKLPVLGICRGMQLISAANGIPLYLDIKTELGIPNREYVFDRIHVTQPQSLMGSLYRKNSFLALELHHQGIRMDYYEKHKNEFLNVEVSALSNKGKIAEAIEVKGMTVLGVQYHPEMSLPETTYPVFKWFLTKACEFKNSQRGTP